MNGENEKRENERNEEIRYKVEVARR